MNLSEVLIRYAPNRVFVSMLLGIVSGLLYATMIPLIMTAVGTPISSSFIESMPTLQQILTESPTHKMLYLFASVLAMILLFSTCSQALLISVSLESTSNLRRTCYRKILSLPIQRLEKIGQPRLMAVLTDDVSKISVGAGVIPGLIIDLITVVGILGFLITINLKVFYFILLMLVIGVVSYQLPMLIAVSFFKKTRERLDLLHEGIRGLILGAKELKLNHNRREDFFTKSILDVERGVVSNDRKGETVMMMTDSYGRLIVFITISVVLFYLAYVHHIGQDDLSAIILGLLYLTTPIEAFLKKLPLIQKGMIAMSKYNAIFREFEEENLAATDTKLPDWKKIRIEKLLYCYDHDPMNQHKFHLGPIDLEIERGEIVFLVGGNGSGKSTLGKLLSQHYIPDEGGIYIDDVLITAANRPAFRETISAIYTDFFLFKSLNGIPSELLKTDALAYLEEMELSHKVKIEEGGFSTIRLSDGQKKRLALVVSFLDNRDLYLFDEWAADQDPSFKDSFYNHILRKLKDMGKTVIVISHDDRYFHIADRLVIMENGCVREIRKPREVAELHQQVANSGT